MVTGTQHTVGPPLRDTPGFGCPSCSAPLALERLTARQLARGLECCGYVPTDEEAGRWVKARGALATVEARDTRNNSIATDAGWSDRRRET